MASFFRSISTKIFGIALGLLLVMLVVALWSASAIERVNRQLTTLAEALIPLALTMEDLRTDVFIEHGILQRHRFEGHSVSACRKDFSARVALADRQIGRIRGELAQGVKLAVTERDKLELARMRPLVDEIVHAHERYTRSSARVCAALETGGGRARNDENEADARELQRMIGSVSEELEEFVLESSKIVEANERRAMQANLVLVGVSSVVGLFLAYLVSRGLTRPIARLRAGTRAVQQGKLDEDVPVTSKDEIGDVTLAFNGMLTELRTKERIKETFGQYVDPRIVAGLIDGSANRSSGGEKRVASLFFSDIAGFTSIAERLAPAALVTLVNDYFATMSAPIRDRSGIIDKYIGDAIMAFWVPPFVEEVDQATLACAAALAQFELLADFNARVPDLIGLRRDVPGIDMRIAIATGEVVVGSVGSDFARSFTVMGDTVNFASRLEGANKVYGTRILIDETTARMAGDAVETREIDLVQVVGRSEPLRVFELVAMAGGIDSGRRNLFDLYAAGVEAYRSGDWDAAHDRFSEALSAMPTDGPSRVMLERVRQIKPAQPAAWDGVWRMAAK